MPTEKRELFADLIDEVRMSKLATDRFDHAVAEALGVNRTDLRCLDVLQREGPIAAGALAAATGLTSGSITTAIDRLERAGYARRVRDAADRRRVLVELAPGTRERADSFYRARAELGERMYRRYSEQQLRLLVEFVREGRQLNEREAARLQTTVHDADRSAAA